MTDDGGLLEGKKGLVFGIANTRSYAYYITQSILEAGGEHYAVLSCLNTSEAGMELLEAIIRRELSGWI